MDAKATEEPHPKLAMRLPRKTKEAVNTAVASLLLLTSAGGIIYVTQGPGSDARWEAVGKEVAHIQKMDSEVYAKNKQERQKRNKNLHTIYESGVQDAAHPDRKVQSSDPVYLVGRYLSEPLDKVKRTYRQLSDSISRSPEGRDFAIGESVGKEDAKRDNLTGPSVTFTQIPTLAAKTGYAAGVFEQKIAAIEAKIVESYNTKPFAKGYREALNEDRSNQQDDTGKKR